MLPFPCPFERLRPTGGLHLSFLFLEISAGLGGSSSSKRDGYLIDLEVELLLISQWHSESLVLTVELVIPQAKSELLSISVLVGHSVGDQVPSARVTPSISSGFDFAPP